MAAAMSGTHLPSAGHAISKRAKGKLASPSGKENKPLASKAAKPSKKAGATSGRRQLSDAQVEKTQAVLEEYCPTLNSALLEDWYRPEDDRKLYTSRVYHGVKNLCMKAGKNVAKDCASVALQSASVVYSAKNK